ncbi:uncharacterized protein LOC107048941 isoform X2 [Diachasma alloeum]|uniref:uncharacterized protein LOC107048941 isoform X2 n=1 Tax=Diachasma alloeum TaxID=454923 RepID=UPI000738307C|nr:uncharacterized protein LOC107048941 isoform X2 [Diachasma alloeum]
MKWQMIVLTLTCLSPVRSSDEDLLDRAAAQLTRLSAFRRTKEPPTIPTDDPGLAEAPANEQTPEDNQNLLMNADAMKRIDELAQAAYNLYKDPNYDAMMQRIKRSGSGDFVSGIANKVVGGVVGAVGGLSSGLSGGSSGPQAHDSYGAPVEPYGPKQFSIFDFKKAILNTVLQALKALAGGALALKGQLIKGGGFVVQTKGRVISSAGEAISSLGSKIASSAVISAPKPVYGAPGYSYDAHHTQDVSYDGPPPSPDATYADHNVYHGPYGSPSSDNPAEEPGLLIVKDAKPGESPHPEDHRHNSIHEDNPPIQDEHHHNHIHVETHPPDASQSVGSLEESFGGPPKGSTVTKFTGVVTGTFEPIQSHQTAQQTNGNDHYYVEHKEQSVQVPQHDAPQALSPPAASDYQGHHQGPPQDVNHQNNQQAFQAIQAGINPHLGINFPNDQPLNYQNQQHNGQQLSYDNQGFVGNYQDPRSYGFSGQVEPLKVPIFEHQNTLDSVNLGVLGLPNAYGVPMHGMDLAGAYGVWKRNGIYRMKKGTYWRYRVSDPKIHRI